MDTIRESANIVIPYVSACNICVICVCMFEWFAMNDDAPWGVIDGFLLLFSVRIQSVYGLRTLQCSLGI